MLVKRETTDLSRRSLKELVKSRNTFLLLDCSGSMIQPVGEERKIDALRKIARDIPEVKKVVFCGSSAYYAQDVPEPYGNTPLAEAIQFCTREGARKLIVISDGLPDSPTMALEAARRFGGPIDVFYVGPPGDRGEEFLRELALYTKGQYAPADLRRPKELTTKIRGLLAA